MFLHTIVTGPLPFFTYSKLQILHTSRFLGIFCKVILTKDGILKGVFRTLPSILDGAFSEISQRFKALNYFHYELRLRCLANSASSDILRATQLGE